MVPGLSYLGAACDRRVGVELRAAALLDGMRTARVPSSRLRASCGNAALPKRHSDRRGRWLGEPLSLVTQALTRDSGEAA
jgi:hypothetical protein